MAEALPGLPAGFATITGSSLEGPYDLSPLKKIEYGVNGDLIIISLTAIFYLLKGHYRYTKEVKVMLSKHKV